MSKPRALYQISLKLLLRNDRGETLILKALEHSSFAGYYDLPGGRIDADEIAEKFVVVLARELAEEIGIVDMDINSKPVAVGRHRIPAALTSEGKDLYVLYLFFEATYHGGEIIISPEHTDFRWVNLRELNPKKYFTSGILEGIQEYLMV